MEYTYEKITNDFGIELIMRTDQMGLISWIPIDEANSDYQEYLNPQVQNLTDIVPASD
jgi:hypothetical protein